MVLKNFINLNMKGTEMKKDNWKKMLVTVLPLILRFIADVITDDKKKKK